MASPTGVALTAALEKGARVKTSVRAFALCVLFTAAVQAQELVRWRGDPTPALVLADLSGKKIDLVTLRGKTVLVNFWATWCAPCVEEMPALQKLQSRLDPRRFMVLAVNVGESRARVEMFLKQVPVDFPIVLDPDSETAKTWKVRGYPSTFIVGPDGKIRYYHVGDLDWGNENIVSQISGIQ